MNVDQMRDVVIQVYLSDKWKTKVAAMSDSQVIAMYFSFKKTGRIK